MPFLPPNQQRQSTEGTYTAVNGMNKFLKFSVKCFIKYCCGLVFVIQKKSFATLLDRAWVAGFNVHYETEKT